MKELLEVTFLFLQLVQHWKYLANIKVLKKFLEKKFLLLN